MDLINYLLNLMIDEKEIVEELLNIDNKICLLNVTYSDLINIIRSTKLDNKQLREEYDVITDGDIHSVIYALINYCNSIKKINIDNFYYGINKWLVTRVNEYLNSNIIIDKKPDYNKYVNKKIIVGEEEFVNGVGEIYPDAIKVIL